VIHPPNAPRAPTRKIFEGQLSHVIALSLLLAALWLTSHLPGFWDGSFLGCPTRGWVRASVACAVLHQTFVWLCWRLELHRGALTKTLAAAAFPAYAILFTILILGRPALLTGLAIANKNSAPISADLARALALAFVPPVIYLGYSIGRYFGFRRAFGIDHFDPKYRALPLVRQGIFRFSSNAMYTFGFLALWIPALSQRSTAALAIALFSHLYIWVHYFATERPDMAHIYGPPRSSSGS